jgi:penicillin amidase
MALSMNIWKRLGWAAVWTAGIVSLLAVIVSIAGTVWLRHAMNAALPQLDGSTTLAGLHAPVTVRRDRHGVPQIEASNEEDLFVAQGYVTAQDRMWQMDMMRRNARGELSEILGREMLRQDIMQRTLGLRRVAGDVIARSSPEDLRIFNAYARGVNLFLEQNADHLPAEFRLLNYKPRRWEPIDTLCIALSMAELLDTHFDTKFAREAVVSRLKDAKLEADLYPVGSWRDRIPGQPLPDLTVPQPEIPDVPLDENQSKLTAPDLMELRQALGRECEECAKGSNNWVLSGKLTASGKPLLSNDMHLGLSEPNIWFIAGLSAPGYHVAGVTLPGVPMVVEGHNDHVAWGITALYGDVQDLYVERTNTQGQYLAADGWRPIEHTHETIHVRLGNDVPLELEQTAHGPIVTALLKHETRKIALKWNIYDPELRFNFLYEINHAANWTEFHKAMADWWAPTQNLVYADDQGHIAYQAVGRIPRRPAGLISTPITDAQHEWKGYLTLDEMPHSVDPPDGLLATANARVTADAMGNPISLDWAPPYRVERIYKSLIGRSKLTRADMLALQGDIYSEVDQELGHRFAYAIDHTPGTSNRLKQAADLMRSWDGRVSVDATAPSILNYARRALWQLILRPKLGDDWRLYEWSEASFAEEEIVMHSDNNWVPKEYKNWDAVLTAAVEQGLKDGHAPHDLSKWNYGSWHTLTVENLLYSQVPWLKSLAGVSDIPYSGNPTTVKAATQGFGPSQRFTMDWSDVDGSTENITMGESSNPQSAYFKDQFADWMAVKTYALPFSQKAVKAATQHTLRLEP